MRDVQIHRHVHDDTCWKVEFLKDGRAVQTTTFEGENAETNARACYWSIRSAFAYDDVERIVVSYDMSLVKRTDRCSISA